MKDMLGVEVKDGDKVVVLHKLRYGAMLLEGVVSGKKIIITDEEINSYTYKGPASKILDSAKFAKVVEVN